MSNSFFSSLESNPTGRRVLAASRLRFRALTVLHEALAQKNITQADLARRLGIRKSAVNQVINGDGNMKLSTLAEYLDALDLEASLESLPSGTLRLRAQMEASAIQFDETDWQSDPSPLDEFDTSSFRSATQVSVRVNEWTSEADESFENEGP